MADDTVRSVQVERSGLVFDVDVAGPADGPLVLLLHGLPQTRYRYPGRGAPAASHVQWVSRRCERTRIPARRGA